LAKILIILGVAISFAIAGWSSIVFVNKKEKKKPVVSSGSSSISGKKKKTERSFNKDRVVALAKKQTTPAFVSSFDPENSYEDGEIIIIDPPKDFTNSIGSLGFSIIEIVRLGELDITVVRLRVPSGQSVRSARRVLLGRFPGLVVDANHQFDPSAELRRRRHRPDTGSAADQLRKRRANSTDSRVRAAIGWKNIPATCGQGVRLGMIDSGVDLKHPALIGQNIEFRSFHNPKRRQGPADHGTAVAAILVGKSGGKGWGGLLPGAELKAANMFEINKIGKKVGNVVALLKGLNWMAQQKVHVVNLSIAGTNNRAVNKAFKIARKKGLVMVAAVGNWGRSDKPAYPAAYSQVLAVTAVGRYRKIYSRANTGDYIEFAAPGVRLWTAVPGGGKYQSGTSFATPYVTALLGLEIAKGANKSPSSLRAILRGSTADLGAPGKDKTYGWGFVEKQPNC
jgi:subtilisin family serine protease